MTNDMNYEIRQVDDVSDELAHRGILGQRWGIRRYQYKDGSLTPEGRKRYGSFEDAFPTFTKWHRKRKEKKAESKERKMEKLLKHGSAKKLSKTISTLDSEQLSYLQERFSRELQVQEQINKLLDKPNNKQLTNKAPVSNTAEQKNNVFRKTTNILNSSASTSKNIEATLSNATKAYNAVAYAWNTLHKNKPGHKDMPIIPTKKEKSNNDGG